jgi:hypothetical protein
MLRIPHESEGNQIEGITTGNKFWFQHSDPSLKMFAGSPTDVVPRTRQAFETKQTIITISFTGRTLIVLDVLPAGSKFNELYFVDHIFPI